MMEEIRQRIISSPFGTGLYDGHTNLSGNSDGSRIRESFGDTYLYRNEIFRHLPKTEFMIDLGLG